MQGLCGASQPSHPAPCLGALPRSHTHAHIYQATGHCLLLPPVHRPHCRTRAAAAGWCASTTAPASSWASAASAARCCTSHCTASAGRSTRRPRWRCPPLCRRCSCRRVSLPTHRLSRGGCRSGCVSVGVPQDGRRWMPLVQGPKDRAQLPRKPAFPGFHHNACCAAHLPASRRETRTLPISVAPRCGPPNRPALLPCCSPSIIQLLPTSPSRVQACACQRVCRLQQWWRWLRRPALLSSRW